MDYEVKVVVGFRVPYDKVIHEEEVSVPKCNHDFDRDNNNFCPECGEESGYNTELVRRVLIGDDLEPDFVFDTECFTKEFLCSGLSFVKAESSGVLEGDQRDFIIGCEVFNEDSKCPRSEICCVDEKLIRNKKSEIYQKVLGLNIKIPFDFISFGVYVIFDEC